MGSKYDPETRERALAMCAAPKMNPGKVAKAMGIPRATVYEWVHAAQQDDEDYIAMRRGKIRSMMDRAYAIVGRSMDGLEKQSKALKLEKSEIDRVLLKICADGALDEGTRESIIKIVREYTGTSMTDMVKIVRETMGIYDKLEQQLGDGSAGGVQVTFDDGLKEMAE